MQDAAENIFTSLFERTDSNNDRVHILLERKGERDAVFERLVTTATDHLIDLRVIERLGGYPRSAHILRNRLPQDKKAASGFLGEILATEYVEREVGYRVPVRRLRYKDGRDLAMRGDDVIGIRTQKSLVKVLKGEAKSRGRLASSVLKEAREGLAKNRGRPNPETLAFLEYILREKDRDEEAEPFERLQKETIRARDIQHLIFTLSGNDPTYCLQSNARPIRRGVKLILCGCKVTGHGAFVQSVFDSCLERTLSDGND